MGRIVINFFEENSTWLFTLVLAGSIAGGVYLSSSLKEGGVVDTIYIDSAMIDSITTDSVKIL